MMYLMNKTPDEIMALVRKDHPEIDRIIADIKTRVRINKDAIWDYQAAALYALVKTYVPKRGKILEIGTSYGFSASIMAEAAPDAAIVTLNPNAEEADAARDSLSMYYNVSVLLSRSQDMLLEAEALRLTDLDLIFVDGDHKNVRDDMPWWNHVKDGGVFFFHDYSPTLSSRPVPPVYEAVNEFAALLGRKPDLAVIDDENTGMAGWIKEPQTITGQEVNWVVQAHSASTCTFEYLKTLYILARGYRDISGSLVECGVQNGGSAAVMALGAKRRNRELWLFDNFAGNPAPDPERDGGKAIAKYQHGQDSGDTWALGSREAAIHILRDLRIMGINIEQGPFAETLPECSLSDIVLLHIDATLYHSTHDALTHLYDRVQSGGLIVVHAYGHWPGCRQAVDDFLASRDLRPILMPVEKAIYWRKGSA